MVFFQYLRNLNHDKALLLVTHKLSAIALVDRILLLDQGTLVAQGTHHELMKTSDLYKNMFNMQAENYLALDKALR